MTSPLSAVSVILSLSCLSSFKALASSFVLLGFGMEHMLDDLVSDLSFSAVLGRSLR